VPISDTTREEARRLARRYPVARSALLPMLHLVQSDEGYVSPDGVALCAEVLGLTKAEVGAVSTFYTMFKREPVGDYLLSVCTNPTCKIAGAQDIYAAYVDKCGGGHHTADGAGVSVEHAECLGICDAAPVVQVNYEMYGPVTHEQAMDLFEKAKAGEPPASNWSNEVPGTFRAVERELSGIEDGTDEHLIEAARLQAAADVPPAYRTGETDLPVTHPGGDPLGHGGEAFRSQAHLGDVAGDPAAMADAMDPTTAAKIADIAEADAGTDGELARHLQSPTEPAPAVQDQPSVSVEGDTSKPAEAERDRAAAGSEQDPSDSMAGDVGGGAERSEHARRSDEGADDPAASADEPEEG
jgi:NADH-quinone oxidoreductase subunit E